MPASRSEPERLLAMAPLAAVVRLAAPTTVVMAVSAVSNVVYTYFVSRLGVDAMPSSRQGQLRQRSRPTAIGRPTRNGSRAHVVSSPIPTSS